MTKNCQLRLAKVGWKLFIERLQFFYIMNIVDEMDNKIKDSIKWTFSTEALGKIITPVTSAILAHILTPEAFGIVAAILVVTSFAEMFADAGFQKYFVQHDFCDDNEKKCAFMTALVTCCISALIIWLVICLFSDNLALFLGAPEIKSGLCVAGSGILLNSFSGMQSAIFKREFQFKLLFKLRFITIGIPIAVTVPLAFLGFDYWSLISGMLVQQIATCVFQGMYSPIPISFVFDINVLLKMLSFSLWTLVEAISIWLSTWGQFLLIGNLLSSYYLGIFRGGITLTSAIFSLLSSSVMPVLFSALSRLQNSDDDFRDTFYKMQKICILIMAPLGFAVFVFRDIIVGLLLGEQWHETDLLVGLLGLVGIFSITINSMISEALRAKGLPKISTYSQVFYFPVAFLVIYFTSSMEFYCLAIGISLCSLELDAVKIYLARKYMGFSIIRICKNSAFPVFSSSIACVLAIVVRSHLDNWWGVIIASVIFCLSYITVVSISKENRVVLCGIYRKILTIL